MGLRRSAPTVAALALLAAMACAKPVPAPRYTFFGEASPEDHWYGKVATWQAQANADGRYAVSRRPGPTDGFADSGAPRLSARMSEFEAAEKRALAERINDWAQGQARTFYRVEEDTEDPSLDAWPTVKQLLATNGDDCDGMDLIAYQLLTEFGFDKGDVFRAIVRRDSNRANHMVTLWFESPEDPWVLDVTGAASLGMARFSEIEGWTPTWLFNETGQWRVVPAPPGGAYTARPVGRR